VGHIWPAGHERVKMKITNKVRQDKRFRGKEKGKYKHLIVLKSSDETRHRSNNNWQR
jgi:hypothetical protein